MSVVAVQSNENTQYYENEMLTVKVTKRPTSYSITIVLLDD